MLTRRSILLGSIAAGAIMQNRSVWAKAAQHRTGDNPTEGLTKVLPKHNREAEHRAALPYGEVPEFIRALRDASKISAMRIFASKA